MKCIDIYCCTENEYRYELISIFEMLFSRQQIKLKCLDKFLAELIKITYFYTFLKIQRFYKRIMEKTYFLK